MIFVVVNSSRSSFNKSFRRLFDVEDTTEFVVDCTDESILVVIRDFFVCLVEPEAHAYPSSVSSFPESSASPFYLRKKKKQ
jgi:hypothetical protein